MDFIFVSFIDFGREPTALTLNWDNSPSASKKSNQKLSVSGNS